MTSAHEQVWVLGGCAAIVVGIVLLAGGERTSVSPGDYGARSLRIGESVKSIPVLVDDEQELELRLADRDKATVIWFWSALCPCIPDCEARIQTMQARYEDRGVRLVAIDPNPQDTAADIEELRRELGSKYPVYRDPDGFSVRLFGVEASASVVVLDGEGRIRYRGAIDDDLYKPTHSYVHAAIDSILANGEVTPTEVSSYGCAYPK